MLRARSKIPLKIFTLDRGGSYASEPPGSSIGFNGRRIVDHYAICLKLPRSLDCIIDSDPGDTFLLSESGYRNESKVITMVHSIECVSLLLLPFFSVHLLLILHCCVEKMQ